MHSQVKRLWVILIVAAIAVPLALTAGNTGKIKGRVIDKVTGKPLPGVSVQIEGTTMGAITGPDGDFLITLVPEGKYNLKVTTLGYTAKLVEAILVAADKTTDEIVIELQMSVPDLNNVVSLSEERDKKLRQTGKDDIDEFLSNTAGVVTKDEGEIIIRGGRAGEVAYIVDGVSIDDPLGGAGPSNIGLPKIQAEMRTSSMCFQPRPGEYGGVYPPAHGGTAIVNGKPYDAMFFENYGVNPFVDTEDDHLSTFAIDVDDASYIMARSYLERGNLPEKDAVRVEEFINHFDYNYPAPENRPFDIFIEGAPSKFGQNCSLLRIGIKGKKIPTENRKAANLVFVIDVSGSMGRVDRLGLVRKALKMLVHELTPRDKVGIVIYGSRGQVLLRPTTVDDEDEIRNAIEQLYPQGSTNAEEGLRLGYEMADRMFEPGKINRIILCSDGVANVGTTGPDGLLEQIKRYAERGITLSSIGFGMGNYNDVLLEKLGDKGNGHYAYVDDIAEAKRIFVENLTGTLQVIARDVKIQVDFNPEVVRSYRLLGYENRDVADDKFRDDKEDGGEIGSGHSVTALYEVKFTKNIEKAENIGTIYIRHKDPDHGEVTEINRAITWRMFNREFENSSASFRLAAVSAEFAEILRKSYWAKESNLDEVLRSAQGVYYETDDADVLELLNLITKAKGHEEQLADR